MGVYEGHELDHVELTGPRVRLRPWQAADAEAVFWALQPEWMTRYLTVPRPYTRDVANLFVTDLSHRLRTRGKGLEVAVVDRESDQLLGSAGIRLPFGQIRAADIGYWVAPSAQGNRYAAEAVRILADWAFSIGVPRAEVRCEPTNLPSARTALAAGHAFESYRRHEIVVAGQPRDTAVFARTAEEDSLPIPPTFPPLPREGLSDGVITLRAMRVEDTTAVVEMEDDPQTTGVSFSGYRADDAELRRMCERAELDWYVGGVARLTVLDVASQAVAGSMQLRKVGPPDVAGIGYVVHPAFRGRGVTARGLRLLADWAFAAGGFARLELGAKYDNIASQRAAMSGGFAPDGVRRARLRNPDGTFSDEVRFALVAPHLRGDQ